MMLLFLKISVLTTVIKDNRRCRLLQMSLGDSFDCLSNTSIVVWLCIRL
jgi:hypothetical protein